MQAPGVLDLDCYQGADFDYQLTWTVSGSAVNVTGYSARMQVRQYADSTAVALSLVTGFGHYVGRYGWHDCSKCGCDSDE